MLSINAQSLTDNVVNEVHPDKSSLSNKGCDDRLSVDMLEDATSNFNKVVDDGIDTEEIDAPCKLILVKFLNNFLYTSGILLLEDVFSSPNDKFAFGAYIFDISTVSNGEYLGVLSTLDVSHVFNNENTLKLLVFNDFTPDKSKCFNPEKPP